MHGTNSADGPDFVSPVTTSSPGTSDRKTRPRSRRSPAKQELKAQREAARAIGQRARRTIVNSLELLLPAIDDLQTDDALKACCEIMRRISQKAATLSVRSIAEHEQQLELFPLEAESA